MDGTWAVFLDEARQMDAGYIHIRAGWRRAGFLCFGLLLRFFLSFLMYRSGGRSGRGVGWVEMR